MARSTRTSAAAGGFPCMHMLLGGPPLLLVVLLGMAAMHLHTVAAARQHQGMLWREPGAVAETPGMVPVSTIGRSVLMRSRETDLGGSPQMGCKDYKTLFPYVGNVRYGEKVTTTNHRQKLWATPKDAVLDLCECPKSGLRASVYICTLDPDYTGSGINQAAQWCKDNCNGVYPGYMFEQKDDFYQCVISYAFNSKTKTDDYRFKTGTDLLKCLQGLAGKKVESKSSFNTFQPRDPAKYAALLKTANDFPKKGVSVPALPSWKPPGTTTGTTAAATGAGTTASGTTATTAAATGTAGTASGTTATTATTGTATTAGTATGIAGTATTGTATPAPTGTAVGGTLVKDAKALEKDEKEVQAAKQMVGQAQAVLADKEKKEQKDKDKLQADIAKVSVSTTSGGTTTAVGTGANGTQKKFEDDGGDEFVPQPKRYGYEDEALGGAAMPQQSRYEADEGEAEGGAAMPQRAGYEADGGEALVGGTILQRYSYEDDGEAEDNAMPQQAKYEADEGEGEGEGGAMPQRARYDDGMALVGGTVLQRYSFEDEDEPADGGMP